MDTPESFYGPEVNVSAPEFQYWPVAMASLRQYCLPLVYDTLFMTGKLTLQKYMSKTIFSLKMVSLYGLFYAFYGGVSKSSQQK
jgi:hypothetical protein